MSEQAQSISNITIGDKNILLQELVNPFNIRFKVFLTKKADCAKTSGWYTGNNFINNLFEFYDKYDNNN